MKYICLGYYDRSKHEAMTEAEKQAMFDTCFTYHDHLRANGHWVGGELLQPAETALTLYWKNGKVELLDKLAKFRVLQNTSQWACRPMRERAIAWSERFDLDRRPPGLRPQAMTTAIDTNILEDVIALI